MKTQDQPPLLLVEDDSKLRKTLELEFQDRGYQVHSASNLREISGLALNDLRFAVIDLRLGSENGLNALELIKTKFPSCRVVMITGYGTIATAVAAMKLGASNYLTKPFDVSALEQYLWVDHPDVCKKDGDEHRESLDRHEREYIEYVLLKCGGNVSRAAKWLQIHRQSLQRLRRKYTL